MKFMALKHMLRILFGQNLIYTAINVIGLSLGITSLVLALLFAKDEFEYDTFHPEYERLYRIVVNWDGDGVIRNWARSSPPIAEMIRTSTPNISPVVRVRKNPGTDLFSVGDNHFYEPHFFIADPEFFELFGFQLKVGVPADVLKDKYSIVLTVTAAIKYFNDPNPIGEVIQYDNKYNLTVTGIASDTPKNTHLYFEMIAPFQLLDEMFSERRLTHWGQFDHYTYGRLSKGTSPIESEEQLYENLKSYAPEWVPSKMRLGLQPIADIHLNSDRHSELVPNSKRIYSYMFLGAAFLVLAMAVFNYINLTLSLFLKRQKEIAMRVILGSSKYGLVIRLVYEAVIVSLVAGGFSLLTIWLLMPHIGLITGKSLLENLSMVEIVGLLAGTVFLGIIAGILPAMHLVSRYRQLNEHSSIRRRNHVRSAIFIGQLSISGFIVLAMLAANRQLEFLYSQSLGYEDEKVIVIPVKDRSNNKNYTTITNALRSVSGVENVSFCSTTPGTNNSLTYTYTFHGAGAGRGETPMAVVIADEQYIPLYGVQLLEGRLPDGNTSKESQDIIINEATVAMLELEEPIGTQVTGKVEGIVVGVVQDFQLNSLHDTPEPMILYNYLPTLRYVSIKLSQSDPQTMTDISKVWNQFYPEYPMEYSYLKAENQNLYSFEKGVKSALGVLQPIVILLVIIGMTGHTLLMGSERAKEFAIRQSLGGSTVQIIRSVILGMWPSWLISLVTVGIVGHLSIRKWFEGFAYHIDSSLDMMLFPVLGMIFLIILIMGGLIGLQLRRSPTKYLRIVG